MYLRSLPSPASEDEFEEFMSLLTSPAEAALQQLQMLFPELPPEPGYELLRQAAVARAGGASPLLVLTGQGSGLLPMNPLLIPDWRRPVSKRRPPPRYSCDTALLAREDGAPFGLLYQRLCVREGKHRDLSRKEQDAARRTREIVDWRGCLAATGEAIPRSSEVVWVGDRESNVHRMFSGPRESNCHLLIRAFGERALSEGDRAVRDAAVAAPRVAEHTLLLGYHARKEHREASLHIQATPVTLRPPTAVGPTAALPPIELTAVRAVEIGAPKNVKVTDWLLLTDMPYSGPEDAVRWVESYNKRWLVHRYNYILRTGCGVTHFRPGPLDSFTRELARCCLTAWRVLWLEHPSCCQSDAPCTEALATPEWLALYRPRYHGPDLPTAVPSLREAIRKLGDPDDSRRSKVTSEHLWFMLGLVTSLLYPAFRAGRGGAGADLGDDLGV